MIVVSVKTTSPENALLYRHPGPHAFLRWLRSLGVLYIVLTNRPPDYSARAEAALISSGRAQLTPVFHTRQLAIYAVPLPRPIVTGPAPATVLSLTQTRVELEIARPGTYRLALRYSPYWHASAGCVLTGRDGMVRLLDPRAGRERLSIQVELDRALETIAGAAPSQCEQTPTKNTPPGS